MLSICMSIILLAIIGLVLLRRDLLPLPKTQSEEDIDDRTKMPNPPLLVLYRANENIPIEKYYIQLHLPNQRFFKSDETNICVIGRGAYCDFCISDDSATISREQAQIVRDPEFMQYPVYYLENLSAENPTEYLNTKCGEWQRLGNKRQYLYGNELFRFGENGYRLQICLPQNDSMPSEADRAIAHEPDAPEYAETATRRMGG